MKIARGILILFAAVAGLVVRATGQTAPVITVQPTNQIVVAGGNASFSVVVAGTGPFTYQWQFNGTNLPGVITTVAGNGETGWTGYGGDGGMATNANLYFPFGVAVDDFGDLFIADTDNNRIREVGPDGIITTVAGNGQQAIFDGGGMATNISLDSPYGITVDGSGNLFIADTYSFRILEVDSSGTIGGVTWQDPPSYLLLNHPSSVAVDGVGNLFIADSWDGYIRKVDTNGIMTSLLTNDYLGYYTVDVPYISGVTVDGFGNLFVADFGGNRVRRIDTNGLITIVAGSGLQGFSGDGDPATNACLSYPSAVAVDALGNLFIADEGNNRIRKVGGDGIITTIAGGQIYGYSGDGRFATGASLYNPTSLATDNAGNLFIADSANLCVRKVAAQGPVLPLNGVMREGAGNYEVVVTSPSGSVTSSVVSLEVLSPPVISAEPVGQYGVTGGNAIFGVSSTGTPPLRYQWFFDGAALSGQTNNTLELLDIGTAQAGDYQVIIANLFGSVTSSIASLNLGNAPIITAQPTNRTVTVGGNSGFAVAVSGTGPFVYQWRFNGANLPNLITTVAGNGETGYSGDGGPATNASLNFPCEVAVNRSGDLFFADTENQRIRRVDTNGVIRTAAGNGSAGYSGDGGAATNASLNNPVGLAVDDTGDLFVADDFNGRVRKIGNDGIITTVAGGGFGGYGGTATNAGLYSPYGIAVDGTGNLFIGEVFVPLVFKVGADGVISPIVGDDQFPLWGYSGDGGAATNAGLNSAPGLAADTAGNLFVADFGNQRVRKVAANGIITTFAGNGSAGYSGDEGTAIQAELNEPSGMAIDAFGNLFIADSNNNRVRKVGTDGVITTVAGNGIAGYSGDGGAATNASLAGPNGVAVDGLGNLFIADVNNLRIRKVIAQGPTLGINNVGITNAGNYDVVVASPFGSVTSSVVTLTIQLPRLKAAIDRSQNLVLQLNGAPGQNWVLQSAGSLNAPINWQPVFTNAADANGNWSFTNLNVSASPALFYRVTGP